MARLVCIDIDNTLIHFNSSNEMFLPPENVSTIQRAISQGIHVSICTGRMPNSALKIAEQVGLDKCYMICYNGALIMKGSEIIYESRLSGLPLEKCLSVIQSNGVYAQFYDGPSYFVDTKQPQTDLYEQKILVKVAVIGGEVYTKKSYSKILVLPKDFDEKKKWLPLFSTIEGICVTESCSNYIEITSSGSTKGEAVKALGSILSIPQSQIMAIGDSYNDVSMLEFAGLPVIMGNADDALKNKGWYVTSTCECAGVSQAMQKFCHLIN
ncbi:hypothetical protein EIN_495700 [Entamoeba invadens IP1]|uniref:Uncharacterized protein n=1 Tax=Entamoeba invadens IP1 TaxID=370355 RepID=A0A0A1U321_ENTIV|nr:hypothetical protein EIN_495700 [Entamoeba invadens IP1]ELP87105.1 hypothetical protein EIN_495700 [Entamoeba invadens IP1]|eukprot:XP_004253876.1 hypothetical protein EIN_495700 [Entamoeba invadens IP1]